MTVLAGSVDNRQDTQKLISNLGLTFPLAYGLDLEETASSLGGFYQSEKGFLQPSGFLIRPKGEVEVVCYSSGAVGRLKAENVLAVTRYYKQKTG